MSTDPPLDTSDPPWPAVIAAGVLAALAAAWPALFAACLGR